MSKNVKSLAQKVRALAGDAPVEIGLILGSGLGHIADMVDGVSIGYDQLNDFPQAHVSGHNPKLVIGQLEDTRVAIFGGRSHYYENGKADAMRPALELLKELGAERLILTNAAGSMRQDVPPGALMQISDHINFSGLNPLIGEQTDARFVPMGGAYDLEMQQEFAKIAEREEIPLASGVYAWYSGPSFETPAEIRAIRTLGADAVGMSTVPEVILARFLGLRVAGFSVITNMAQGLSDEAISHEHTKSMAPLGAKKLEKLVRGYLRRD